MSFKIESILHVYRNDTIAIYDDEGLKVLERKLIFDLIIRTLYDNLISSSQFNNFDNERPQCPVYTVIQLIN